MDDSSDGQHLISKFVAKNWTDIFGDTPFSMFQNITLDCHFRQSVYSCAHA
jgi:hypothetical protein